MNREPSLSDALVRLYARASFGMHLGLEPMVRACARTGHPERAFAAVHVAGTNGKGSVSAMVEAIARADGRRTGLYTSPHLCRFAERICVDGQSLDDGTLASVLTRALDAGPDLSFFEVATLAAFFAFRDARVDLAVIEVGLGGRLDATNVLPQPQAAAITRIALDHTDRLGPTLVDIAREKAGIAKRGLDIVVGPTSKDVRQAIDEVAHAAGATTTGIDEIPNLPALPRIGLAGAHQHDNARIAAALGMRIGASAAVVRDAIAEVRWPGRLETIGDVLLDGAHNPDGAASLAAYVRSLKLPPDRVALVFGALADKDWGPMLDTLAPCAAHRIYIALTSPTRAGVTPEILAARHPGRPASSVEEALCCRAGARVPSHDELATAPRPALTIVAGSLMLVGQARACLLGLPRDPPVAL